MDEQNKFPERSYVFTLEANDFVDRMMEPTDLEMWAYVYAIESYRDHERYGAPYEGGYMLWPWVYKLSIDCVKDAIATATNQARAEARKDDD